MRVLAIISLTSAGTAYKVQETEKVSLLQVFPFGNDYINNGDILTIIAVSMAIITGALALRREYIMWKARPSI